MLVFEETGKPKWSEKNLSEQRRELTGNSTHLSRWHRDLSPYHIGGRRVLLALRHPCSPANSAIIINPMKYQRWVIQAWQQNHPGFPVVRSCISSWRNAIITEKGAPCLSLHLSCPAVFDSNIQPMHFPTPWTRNILVPAVSHQRFRLSCSSFAFSRRYLTQVTFRF